MKKSARFVLPSLLAIGLSFGVTSAQGAAGSLDPTFGKGGIVETSFFEVVPLDAQLQPDGKVVVYITGNVVRYLSNGALDTSFGRGGFAQVSLNGTSGSVALQSDGKIVVAGSVESANVDEFALLRLNPNGSVDTGFGSSGEVTTQLGFPGLGEAVLVQPDGKILLGAQIEPAGRRLPFKTVLARYNPDGSPDTAFGNDGTVSVVAVGGVTTLALLSDGQILALNGTAIAQFTSTGSLESTVTGGRIIAKSANIFQTDGRYIVAETVVVGTPRNHDFDTHVVRFTAAGGLDSTFNSPTFDFVGEGGSGNEDAPGGAALQANGQIVVVGAHSHDFSNTLNALARLNSDGSFDSTFGDAGIVTNNLPSGTDGLEKVLIQPDGKILAIGTANNFTELVLERYLAQ